MKTVKSGFNIKVTCTQDPSIQFACKTKKRPGVKLGAKIDVSTDSDSQCRIFEPSPIIEITDGQLTVLDDPENAAKIIAILGKKGTITFTETASGKAVQFADAWFASYIPDEIKLDPEPPTATITIQSSGTLPLI